MLLWARLDDGIPPLPADIWTRLAGLRTARRASRRVVRWRRRSGPADDPGGDTGVVTFPVAWPALDGVSSVGLLVLTTATADPLTGGPTVVPALLAGRTTGCVPRGRRTAAGRRPHAGRAGDRAGRHRGRGRRRRRGHVGGAEHSASRPATSASPDGSGSPRLPRLTTSTSPPAGPRPALGSARGTPLVADLALLAGRATRPVRQPPSSRARWSGCCSGGSSRPGCRSGPGNRQPGSCSKAPAGRHCGPAVSAAAALGFPVGGPGAPQLQTSLLTGPASRSPGRRR